MSHGNASGGLRPGYLGEGGWFDTRDHKRIAVLFLGWTLGTFLLGLIYALMMKLRATSGIVDTAAYHTMFTQHGLLMVFLYIVPVIPAVLGHFVLPLQLGARNLALPGFSVWSFRLYAVGTLLFLGALVFGPVATGWAFLTPFALDGEGAFALMACGLACAAASWFLMGLNFITTVHTLRAPGMGFFRMPLMSWSLYLSGYLLTAVGALFGIIILYLAAARATGKGVFGAEADPLLWQNYFWFVTTPAAFFALLPAAGVISDVVAGMARKAVTGYRLAVGAMIALLAASFVTWGVHMLGSGQEESRSVVFAALNLVTVIPVALLAYVWLATLHRGAVACAPPTTFMLAFLLQAGIGALTGLFFSNPATGTYLANTVFATAHSHYVMMGGVMTALLAGLHYWWPKMTGRMYRSGLGRASGVFYMVGLNLTFIPQIIQGVRGVPRGVYELPAEVAGLETISMIGVWVMVTGLVLVVANLFGALFDGPAAEDDPWGADTLEWKTTSPPPPGNFGD